MEKLSYREELIGNIKERMTSYINNSNIPPREKLIKLKNIATLIKQELTNSQTRK